MAAPDSVLRTNRLPASYYPTHHPIEWTAFEQAEAIRAKEVSPVELVEEGIRRIEEVNLLVNAVVERRFEEARREAKIKEAEAMRSEDLPPLHGVPFSLKETFAMRQMSHSAGFVARQHVRAQQHSDVVERLLSAGAIPLCVTNVPELAMWMDTDNRLTGQTRNPYHPNRIAGGSSGGEGALIGAGTVAFGIGSDVGGSIRLPSYFCGIYGHKPTGGLISLRGHFPAAEGALARYCVAGPMARSARDLLGVLEILARPNPHKPHALPQPEGPPEQVSFRGRKVLFCEDLGIPLLEPTREVRQTLRRASRFFADQGAQIEPWSSPRLRSAIPIWAAMINQANQTPFHKMLGYPKPRQLWGAWLRLLLGRSPHTVPSLLTATMELLTQTSQTQTEQLARKGRVLQQELKEALGPNGILLLPTYPRVSPPQKTAIWLYPFHWIYSGLVNVLEFPSTSVPFGLNRSGLPLGLQIVAPHHRDDLCIAGALALDQHTGGWIPPRLLDL